MAGPPRDPSLPPRRSDDPESDPTGAPPSGTSPEPPAAEDAELEVPQQTPFDHPLFMPVLFGAFSLWFGYDAYLNQDPEMLENLEFNRFGLRVVVYGTLMTGIQGWSELRGTRPSPWLAVAVHALFAGWFAFDALGSSDPFYEPYRPFNLHAAWALAAATAVLAVLAPLGAARPKGAPAWILPGLVAVLAAGFGVGATRQPELALLYASTAAGLLCMAVWLGRRALARRRS